MPRSYFWLYLGFLFGISVVLGAADDFIGFSETAKMIIGIFLLPLFLIGLIVQIKRFHDLDQSGWLVLLNLIPCVGGFVVLIICGFIEGTRGPNKYGPDPIRPDIVEADVVGDENLA